MTIYEAAAAKVAQKVAAYGVPVTLVRGSTELAAYAIRRACRLAEVDGSLVKAGDQVLLLAAAPLDTFEPTPGDRVRIDGKAWTVVTVTPFAPGPLALQYSLQVRR